MVKSQSGPFRALLTDKLPNMTLDGRTGRHNITTSRTTLKLAKLS